MKKYDNLPKIRPDQLKTYIGTSGFLARNSVTSEFVAFDGIKIGGYSFMDAESLDQYLTYGILQNPEIEEKVSTSPVPIEEEVNVENTEEQLSI